MTELRRLLALYRPYRAWMAAGVLLSTATLLSNVALMALAGWFIASMALAGLGDMPFFSFFAPAAIIRGLAIVRTIFRYLERLVTHDATLRLLSALRTWFYEKLEPLAPAGLHAYRRGDLLSRIRADIDCLDNFYLRVLAPAASAALAVVLLLVWLASLSWLVALACGLGLAFAGVVLPLAALRLGRVPGARTVATRAALRAAVADSTRGAAELRVYAATGRQSAAIDALSDMLLADQHRLAAIRGLAIALTTLAAALAMVAAVLVAVPPVSGGGLARPDLPMIALFVLAAFDAVATLPAAFQSLGETRAAARRIFEIADAAPAVADPPTPAARPDRFDIDAEGLTLFYPGNPAPALLGLSFRVAQGEAMAIIGPTGAGKTSVLNAILRFHDYQGGSVRIGGVEVRDLAGEEVRRLCAVVAQDTHLFNATIRDNLRLARPEAADGELHDALGEAAVLDEVLAFPDGLDTIVGEAGARLSGGQARRIAIARALLKDAPILLLDEPTEGLDADAEDLVLAALRRLIAGRTTLLVTHRPRALTLAVRVLRIDHGFGEMVGEPGPDHARSVA